MSRPSFLAVAVFVLSVALVACAQEEQAGTAGPGATPEPEDTPAPTLAPPVTAPQLAYIDGAGDMWLADADGSGRRNLTGGWGDSPRCPRPMGLYWSSNGDWLACVGTGSAPDEQTSLWIVDPEGRPLMGMEPKAYLDRFSWSPTGEGYAYELVLPDSTRESDVESIGNCGPQGLSLGDVRGSLWSPDGSQLAYTKGPGDTLAIYDLASRQEKLVMDGLRPLAWVLGGKDLLVASDKPGDGMFATYAAYLLDPATGEQRRVPELDNDVQFWPSPDGRTVAFITRQAGAEISFLDLTTGAVTPIPGAIPYAREWIPPDHVALSPDGSQLSWADLLPAPAEGPRSVAIYRAGSDGSAKAKLGEIETVELRFSPDATKVLYRATDHALWVANVDGSDARLLAEDAWPAAWRPLPPSQPALAAAPSAGELSAEQAIEHALGILAADPQSHPDPTTAKATRMTEREARALLAQTGQWTEAPASDRPVWLVEVEGEFHGLGLKVSPPGPGKMLMIVCADGRGGGAAFIPDE